MAKVGAHPGFAETVLCGGTRMGLIRHLVLVQVKMYRSVNNLIRQSTTAVAQGLLYSSALKRFVAGSFWVVYYLISLLPSGDVLHGWVCYYASDRDFGNLVRLFQQGILLLLVFILFVRYGRLFGL